MRPGPEIQREIRTLEERLLDPRVRSNSELLGELLAEEFLEFGGSGRAWNRRAIVRALREELPSRFGVTDFQARRISKDAVLATYRLNAESRSPDSPRASLRSSIWVERDGRWQLLVRRRRTTCRRMNLNRWAGPS